MNFRNVLCRFAAAAVVLYFGTLTAHAQCGPMDVVFVIDNTASMTDVISQVQQGVNNIADVVTQSSNGDYQFGLVVAPSNDVKVLLDLGPKNRDAFGAAAAQMNVVSSCGEPAAWDDGLDTVLHALAAGRKTGGGNGTQSGAFAGQFRPNATKIIIVISDARPNHTIGCDFTPGSDDAFVVGLAAEAASRGIRMATVFVPTESAQIYGFGDTIQSIMAQMAETSDGTFLTTQPDASDLQDVIEDIVVNCGTSAGLIVDPTEVLLANGESANVKVTNYRPGKNPSTLFYTSSGLPSDSTVTFTPAKPDVAGTDQQSMKVTIGPDTLAGTYILDVNAQHTDSPRVQSNYVLVVVDCAPPMILNLPGNQPASTTVASGGKATLTVVPNGTAGVKYQWYQGHSGNTLTPIVGATSATLTTPAITQPTEFWVRLTNACGTVDSQTATVSTQ